jgi:hypothetical protein
VSGALPRSPTRPAPSTATAAAGATAAGGSGGAVRAVLVASRNATTAPGGRLDALGQTLQ